MGDIGALRGVWNIVPTPFLPDGALDLASIPTLVDFVRATGVDGLTILGVLGEAARLGDARADRRPRGRDRGGRGPRSPSASASRTRRPTARSPTRARPRPPAPTR